MTVHKHLGLESAERSVVGRFHERYHGTRFRTFNIIDDQVLAIEVDTES